MNDIPCNSWLLEGGLPGGRPRLGGGAPTWAAFIIFLYLLRRFWNQIFTCERKKKLDSCIFILFYTKFFFFFLIAGHVVNVPYTIHCPYINLRYKCQASCALNVTHTLQTDLDKSSYLQIV